MEDVSPPSDREVQSEMPESGNDPGDPLRPDVEEEHSPDPPVGAPREDIDAAEKDDDIAALESAESELSDLDEADFEEFDAANIAIDDRPAVAVDESNVALLGVHKRKRGEGEQRPKKKREGRREKKRRARRDSDDNFSGGEQLDGKRTRKRKEGGGERRKKEKTPVNEEDLTPEERRRRALQKAMDDALKGPGKRRRKQDGIDLESMQDAEIESMRRRMADAAQADTSAREHNQPAFHKLKLLPEVVELLNRNTIQHNLVDPDINLLEAVRFFLEPLNDGSMPAYNIQRDLIQCLQKLPITKDALVASGLGKVAWFYTKTTKCEPGIKRAAEKLLSDWTRPILRKSADYKKRNGEPGDDGQALPDRSAVAASAAPVNAREAAARERLLEVPNLSGRARAAVGPEHSYTIVPKSSNVVASTAYRPGASGEDAFRRIKARQMGKLGGKR